LVLWSSFIWGLNTDDFYKWFYPLSVFVLLYPAQLVAIKIQYQMGVMMARKYEEAAKNAGDKGLHLPQIVYPENIMAKTHAAMTQVRLNEEGDLDDEVRLHNDVHPDALSLFVRGASHRLLALVSQRRPEDAERDKLQQQQADRDRQQRLFAEKQLKLMRRGADVDVNKTNEDGILTANPFGLVGSTGTLTTIHHNPRRGMADAFRGSIEESGIREYLKSLNPPGNEPSASQNGGFKNGNFGLELYAPLLEAQGVKLVDIQRATESELQELGFSEVHSRIVAAGNARRNAGNK